MKFAIIQFPGSNCDRDCQHVIQAILKCPVDLVWHKATSLRGYDVVVLPGGFSYGDYLRCGAIAKQSPIMREVVTFAREGRVVIGICNGFQILTEAGLLPGVLMRNKALSFICRSVYLKIENRDTPFTRRYSQEAPIRLPIAHAEGNYFVDSETVKRLEEGSQIVLRYCNEKGEITQESNPNGSLGNIAGIINKSGNVLGLMPHPERVCDELLGGRDGLPLFESVLGN